MAAMVVVASVGGGGFSGAHRFLHFFTSGLPGQQPARDARSSLLLFVLLVDVVVVLRLLVPLALLLDL